MNQPRRTARDRNRNSSARLACLSGGHTWQPAWAHSELLCPTRGAKAVCPSCVPLFPEQARTLRLVTCARHRQPSLPTRAEGAV